MITRFIITIIMCLAINIVVPVYAQEKTVFLREDFNNIDNWRPLHFAKIKEHSQYSIENNGRESFLKTKSNGSASGIVFNQVFNVFEFPKIKWRWRVSNVYKKGDAEKKSGDDYPGRVYIIFQYDPENAPFAKRIRYGLVSKLYGEYPPDSTLNYIWANKRHEKRILTNTYAIEAKMIILQSGPENTGQWVEQEVNIIEDYHEAFREDPPETASIAIMNDSDNTGESSVSYFDYIEVYR